MGRREGVVVRQVEAEEVASAVGEVAAVVSAVAEVHQEAVDEVSKPDTESVMDVRCRHGVFGVVKGRRGNHFALRRAACKYLMYAGARRRIQKPCSERLRFVGASAISSSDILPDLTRYGAVRRAELNNRHRQHSGANITVHASCVTLPPSPPQPLLCPHEPAP